MKSSSNTYRGTNHPDDLHEFLNRAILNQTETRGITVNSELIRQPSSGDAPLPTAKTASRWRTKTTRRYSAGNAKLR